MSSPRSSEMAPIVGAFGWVGIVSIHVFEGCLSDLTIVFSGRKRAKTWVCGDEDSGVRVDKQGSPD